VINPVNIRPGRISSSIILTPPKEEAAAEFVKVYARNKSGNSLLHPDVELAAVGKSLAGFVPAFILEAVNRAKGAVIFRHGADIEGKITTEDLMTAATSLTDHIDLMKGKQKTSEEVFAEASQVVFDHLIKESGPVSGSILEKGHITKIVEGIRDRVG